MIRDVIQYDKRWGKQIVVFEDVPVETCPQCGEIWLDGKTTEKMEKLFLKKTKPTHVLTVPAWSLKKAA